MQDKETTPGLMDDKNLPPSRAVPLQGVSNFRDLGGYVGWDGRTLRWRKLFRSAQLGALTPQDVAAVTRIGVTRVFDFRGVQERKAAPCALPRAQVHALSVEPSVVQLMGAHLSSGTPLSAGQMVGYMQQTYRDFVHHNTPRFAELMAHVLASDDPLVFHCTAGKDRTGFAAAMLLLALGVSQDTVMEDYLLTNRMPRRELQLSGLLTPEVRAVLDGVQADFLEASFDVIARDHGGIASYLAHGLGVGPVQRERLAALYLEA